MKTLFFLIIIICGLILEFVGLYEDNIWKILTGLGIVILSWLMIRLFNDE